MVKSIDNISNILHNFYYQFQDSTVSFAVGLIFENMNGKSIANLKDIENCLLASLKSYVSDSHSFFCCFIIIF